MTLVREKKVLQAELLHAVLRAVLHAVIVLHAEQISL